MLGCCSFLYGGKRTGVFADGTPTDMVCRMQGYDHGSVGSIPWSLYCGANLSDQLGCMIDMKYLLVPSMKQKMAKALWDEVLPLCLFWTLARWGGSMCSASVMYI